jgi:predicted metal-dependent enzyme (double-stranded beta helix superfamily)
MSPVHGHRTWCAFGVHRGCLVESFFRLEGELPVQARCLQRGAGAVSHGPADPASIHRLANLGTGTAVSIHVYGAAFDRLGEAVNRVWAA